MIKILGVKRVVMVAALLALNGILLASNYFYFTPERTRVERSLSETKNKIAGIRSEAERLRTEIDQIEDQKSAYENLTTAGFFSPQNRLVGKARIEDAQRHTGIIKAGYSIGNGEVVENAFAADAGYAILKSPVTISIEAMDDVDVYNFLFWMENSFPGHMTLETFNLRRVHELNEATIRQIGSGIPTVMIEGNLQLSWRTMVSEDVVRSAAQSFSGEF